MEPDVALAARPEAFVAAIEAALAASSPEAVARRRGLARTTPGRQGRSGCSNSSAEGWTGSRADPRLCLPVFFFSVPTEGWLGTPRRSFGGGLAARGHEVTVLAPKNGSVGESRRPGWSSAASSRETSCRRRSPIPSRPGGMHASSPRKASTSSSRTSRRPRSAFAVGRRRRRSCSCSMPRRRASSASSAPSSAQASGSSPRTPSRLRSASGAAGRRRGRPGPRPQRVQPFTAPRGPRPGRHAHQDCAGPRRHRAVLPRRRGLPPAAPGARRRRPHAPDGAPPRAAHGDPPGSSAPSRFWAGRCHVRRAGSGSLSGALPRLAAELGVSERVLSVGPVGDDRRLSDWYRAADLFVLPTTAYEGSGWRLSRRSPRERRWSGRRSAPRRVLGRLDPRIVAQTADPEVGRDDGEGARLRDHGGVRLAFPRLYGGALGLGYAVGAWEKALEEARR